LLLEVLSTAKPRANWLGASDEVLYFNRTV
jgi:hypothetical protein